MWRMSLVLILSLGCAGARMPSVPASSCEPEDEDGFEDDDGCADLDDDRDGVADAQDLCRCHAEDVDDFEDGDGCPDLDNDRDRMDDTCDLCPNNPETYNGICDEDGCPDHSICCFETGLIAIVDRIAFAERSAELNDNARTAVETVAQTLLGNPQVERLVVHGHAREDEPGAERLAEARANAVITQLLSRGIAPNRLVLLRDVGGAREVIFHVVRVSGEDIDPHAPAAPSTCNDLAMQCDVPPRCPPSSAPIAHCEEASTL